MIRRRIAAAFAGAALVIGLAGCASTGPLDGSAAAAMQDSVTAVAQLAANGDPNGANARLDQLQTQLDSAIDGDLVTAARAARIQNAIDAVRADLAALIAVPAQPTPAESTPAEDSGSSSGSGSGSGQGNGDTVSDNGSSNDNSGPGNNNGNPDSNNGKGNGKGNGGKGNG